MRFTTMEKNLSILIEPELRDVTPGVQIRAFQAGKIVCDIGLGQTYAYYDLASLTKIIFSVQAMMLAYDRGTWNLKTLVKDKLPWYRHKTSIRELMCHYTGFEAWRPFYKTLDIKQSFTDKRVQLKTIIAEADPKIPVDKSLYSDINFLLVGYLLEDMFEKNILEVWNDIKETFYRGTTLEFHLDNQAPHRKALYAPTEECPWRGRLLQGEVHDENTWALGGVSSHAGLFGTIDDMGWYALHLRSQLLGIARYEVKQKTAQLFSKKTVEEGKGDWAMGFMMPTPGQSSCGHYFDLSSIGHTGFTGTSAWYDPKMDLAVCILSNRLVYGRENNRFKELRPKIHNWLVEGLRKSA